MVAHIIGFVLQNLPALLFVVALLVAAARGRHGPVAGRFLSWILLLPIGITGLWAGAFHVFFPTTAAKLIGWEVSPFQFEVGMADLAIGATTCIAFWRDVGFKAAASEVGINRETVRWYLRLRKPAISIAGSEEGADRKPAISITGKQAGDTQSKSAISIAGRWGWTQESLRTLG
jgi:hypothetical protein